MTYDDATHLNRDDEVVVRATGARVRVTETRFSRLRAAGGTRWLRRCVIVTDDGRTRLHHALIWPED